VRQRDDLHPVLVIAIDEKVREMAQRNTTHVLSGTHPSHAFADANVTRDEIDRRLDIAPQTVTQTGTVLLVP
jgi:hypothetical protein